MSDQFLRKISLLVVQGQEALDLSQFQIKFTVTQSDFETPNSAVIRIYNLKDTTASTIRNEYQRVILQAGYETGAFGVIFDGTIKQTRVGKETNVDKYLDILAADGDTFYNFGFVNSSLSAGATPQQQLEAVSRAVGVQIGYSLNLASTALSRQKVLFGLARSYVRDIANTAGASWSVQNGKLQLVPVTGYRPGQAAVINSQTGMIGIPEVTQEGIRVRTLLNPNIVVGGTVQLNSRDISLMFVDGQFLWASTSDLNKALARDPKTGASVLPVVTQGDGLYKVLVNEYRGDVRGTEWYSELTCLAVDATAPAATSVNAYGGQ